MLSRVHEYFNVRFLIAVLRVNRKLLDSHLPYELTRAFCLCVSCDRTVWIRTVLLSAGESVHTDVLVVDLDLFVD